MRAVFEILIQCFATGSADTCSFVRLPGKIRPGRMPDLLTAVAHDKGLTLFNSEYRNKEQAEVMVRALIVGLMQSANRASAGLLI
jgi:hypothetical protein